VVLSYRAQPSIIATAENTSDRFPATMISAELAERINFNNCRRIILWENPAMSSSARSSSATDYTRARLLMPNRKVSDCCLTTSWGSTWAIGNMDSWAVEHLSSVGMASICTDNGRMDFLTGSTFSDQAILCCLAIFTVENSLENSSSYLSDKIC